MSRKLTGRRKAAFVYIDMICTICLILVMFSLITSYSASSLARARRTTCMNNLREINTALSAYALDYGGAFPTDYGLRALHPMYTADAKVLTCPDVAGKTRMHPWDVQPSRSKASALPVDYAYRPGLYSDDLPYMAIAADFTTHTHRYGANILYLDGSADFRRFDEDRETAAMLIAGELDVRPSEGRHRQ